VQEALFSVIGSQKKYYIINRIIYANQKGDN
jgi:hypothetical protein